MGIAPFLSGKVASLGVLKAQMDDFNHFHDQWYLDDLGQHL